MRCVRPGSRKSSVSIQTRIGFVTDGVSNVGCYKRNAWYKLSCPLQTSFLLSTDEKQFVNLQLFFEIHFIVALRPQKPPGLERGVQNSHLDFHTETYGVINYGSGCRKDVGNQWLELGGRLRFISNRTVHTRPFQPFSYRRDGRTGVSDLGDSCCRGSVTWHGPTLRASLSGTFLQTLPELVMPLKGHSLFPRSRPRTWSAASERFGWY